MGNHQRSLFVVPFLAFVLLQGQSQAGERVETLQDLKPKLEALLEGIEGSSVSLHPWGLAAEYRVQEFQVHGVSRDGVVAEAPHTVRGPNQGGFLLRVRVQDGPRYQGPIALSSEGFGALREPYWMTQVREIPLPGGQHHAWVALAQGAKVDQELMARIHAVVHRHLTE